MRLKVIEIEEGLNPSQVTVSIDAQDGVHFLVLNKSSVDVNSTIEVGNPVGRRDQAGRSDPIVLVELPTETDSGTWRLWVDRDSLSQGTLEAAE